MPETAPGTRVFAIRNDAPDVVYLYGHGVYDGRCPISDDPIPDPLPQSVIDAAARDEQWFDDNHDQLAASNVAAMRAHGKTEAEVTAWLTADAKRIAEQPPFADRVLARARARCGPVKNPRITLDDGRGIVWGIQCWWAPETRYDEVIAGRSVELVNPEPLPGQRPTR